MTMGKSHEAEFAGDSNDFLRQVSEPVGPVRAGRVLTVDHELGTGYVVEDGTGDHYRLARRWISAKVFATLEPGSRLQFRINAHNTVTEVGGR